MSLTKEQYHNYVGILKEELVAALGCTEPIAIAYAAAKAREVLGEEPEHIVAECSGNIVKNVKGVIVPTTKNLRGIEAAAIIGVVGGNPALELEVLTEVNENHLKHAKELMEKHICEAKLLDTAAKLHIIIRLESKKHSARVEIIHTHTGIVRIEKDGKVLLDIPHSEEDDGEGQIDRQCLTVEGIIEFANAVKPADVKDLLERQIHYNTQISEEGLKNAYGAQVGKTLEEHYDAKDVRVRACAAAAAGSDARMSGCELPVVINSGSGNQGMTVSLPVIEYAKAEKVSREKLYRALCVSNLVAVHLKAKIGRLSAFCGAVSAATGAGAGIAYMKGYSLEVIEQTIVNTLGNVGGIVCDGAKSSCAAKIAASVNAALMGMEMAASGCGFQPGEGLVKPEIEKTIGSFSCMAKDGMRSTDEEILNIMLERG
jgi:L-cysteine desulfidase